MTALCPVRASKERIPSHKRTRISANPMSSILASSRKIGVTSMVNRSCQMEECLERQNKDKLDREEARNTNWSIKSLTLEIREIILSSLSRRRQVRHRRSSQNSLTREPPRAIRVSLASTAPSLATNLPRDTASATRDLLQTKIISSILSLVQIRTGPTRFKDATKNSTCSGRFWLKDIQVCMFHQCLRRRR
jgi:hypothetical protein